MLATSKEVVLPIKEVWKSLAAEGKRQSFDVPALTDFDALLEGDKRFEILSAQTEPDELDAAILENGEEIDANLGTLGFYAADRVKLRRIAFTGPGSNGAGKEKMLEEDEEVVPLNVRGLSATRPVRPVEKNKLPEKKSDRKASVLSPSLKRPTKKKKPQKSKSSRKPVGKNSRRTR